MRETLTQTEAEYFAQELALHEAKYLVGTNPRQQSGFGRDAHDWERFRRSIVAPCGLLLICSYGSSRPEGGRAEPLVDELQSWGSPRTESTT